MRVWEIIFTEKNKIKGNAVFEKILVMAMLSHAEEREREREILTEKNWGKGNKKLLSRFYRRETILNPIFIHISEINITEQQMMLTPYFQVYMLNNSGWGHSEHWAIDFKALTHLPDTREVVFQFRQEQTQT